MKLIETPQVKSNPPTTIKSTVIPGLLAIGLFQQSPNLMSWLLIGVSAGIVIIFVLLAFILLPLTRRGSRPKADPPAVPPTPAPADTDATTIATPPVEAPPKTGDDDTDPSLQIVRTVAEPTTLPTSGQRPADIAWSIVGLTDVGLKRELNEDSLVMIEDTMDGLGPYGIYVVADGLGGHEAGEVASRLTVEAVEKQYQQNPPTAATAPFEEWLKDAIMLANESVLHHQQASNEATKMGSTLVMALVAGQNAHIVNVGDSRAYRLNSTDIEQISVDHSLVERLVQIGQITREEARDHKQKNVIYSVIGEKRRLEIGTYHVALDPGERLLLCSDGLSGMLTDEELLNISHQNDDPIKACRQMVEAAKQAGGHDNITAIIIQMN